MKRIVVGLSGASGALYGIRFLELLRGMPDVETHLIVSEAARRTIVEETDVSVRGVESLATRRYPNRDIGAALASGSFHTDGMVVVPCSIKTAAAIAHCLADTLIARAADVTLKEGRPLILVVRESPLHLGHLRTMVRLAEMGAVIAPPLPAFYAKPASLEEMVDQSVGRALDLFGLSWTPVKRWGLDLKPLSREA